MLHPTPDQDAILSFSAPGTQMLLFESTDALSNLPSIRYNDYAKVEGLTPALEYRARTGQTEANGRESYSRRCKALIDVGGGAGGKPNPAITRPVGFTLEIVPAISPYALKPGQLLPVQVLYQGRPLAGALVKLTNLEFDVRPVSIAPYRRLRPCSVPNPAYGRLAAQRDLDPADHRQPQRRL